MANIRPKDEPSVTSLSAADRFLIDGASGTRSIAQESLFGPGMLAFLATVSGNQYVLGPGSTTNGIVAGLTLNGSSGINSGATMRFQRNSVNLFAFGNSSSILGGGSSPAGDDFVIYSYVSGAGVTPSINISSTTGSVTVGSNFGTTVPTTKTANYSLTATDNSLIFNGAGSLTLTLQSAATYPGRWLMVKTITIQSVVSSATNVVPLAGGATAAAILPAGTAGKWAWLQSDGTNWIIMASN